MSPTSVMDIRELLARDREFISRKMNWDEVMVLRVSRSSREVSPLDMMLRVQMFLDQ